MSERAWTAVLALGALALFYLLFIGSPARLGDDSTPRPTTAELRGEGYAAAMAWLQRSGVRVVSWRERYGKLGRANFAERGNVLIVTLPVAAGFRTEELLPLDRWVRAGNTLLIMASLTDSLPWSSTDKSESTGDIALLSGLEFRATPGSDAEGEPSDDVVDDSADELIDQAEREAAGTEHSATLEDELRDLARTEPLTIEMVPRGAHPLLAGVERLEARSESQAQAWALHLPLDDFAFTLARLATRDEGTLFLRSHGQGRIIVATTASVFSNRALGEADNARLLANIVAHTVSVDGAVLFDDLRQGLAASYEPERFWRDSRLHWTLAVLVGLWFTWVLGGTRLRAERNDATAPDEVALIGAAGGLLSRALKSHTAALYLLTRFLNDIDRDRGGARVDLAAWDRIAAEPRVRRVDAERLRHWHAAALAGRRVPLVKLQQTLGRVRRQWQYEGEANVGEVI